MTFPFTCPYCFKKTIVDESLAGQSGPCVSCGKTIVVPEPPRRPVSAFQAGATQASADSSPSPALHDSHAIASQRANSGQRRQWLAYGIKSVALTAGLGVMASLFLYVFWPALVGLKARRDKAACMGNLIQVANALNAYASTHGTYPPAVVYDSAGKPMHSWRVLILRELGEMSLHARYKFDEPWDSTNNAMLLGQACPQVYISPGIAGGTRGVSETNYFLITGPGTLFPGTGPNGPAPFGPKQIGDDPSSTLLVVESDTRLVEWTKPVDIDITKMNPRIGASGPDTIGGTHAGGASAVFVDGTAAWLPDDLSATLLQALISPSGNEPVNAEQFRKIR